MNNITATDNESPELLFKIGTVSELTSIPVTTLRDWEIRYKALHPQKTNGRHRMFRQTDIERAHLFKRLNSFGQSISRIAHLDNPQLTELLQKFQSSKTVSTSNNNQTTAYTQSTGSNHNKTLQSEFAAQAPSFEATVIGLGLARRLESGKFTKHLSAAQLRIRDVYSDLSSVLTAPSPLMISGSQNPASNGLIILNQNEIHTESANQLIRLLETHPGHQIIVLYLYAPSSWVEVLKSKGLTLKREPITDSDLAQLLSSFLIIEPKKYINAYDPLHAESSLTLIPPRKYSSDALSKISEISTQIFCECPHHVCGMIEQLASFEKYSQECLSNSTDDANLHAYLSSVSGTARALFERALEKIAAHEGIELPLG